MDALDAITYMPIGVVHSPFTTLEAMPLQTIAAQGVAGSIKLAPAVHAGLKDLEAFSHLLLLTERARRKPLGLRPGGEAGVPWREPAVLICYHIRAARWESSGMSEPTTQRTCRTTYKEKLRPTPQQEQELEAVLWRCRTLLTAASSGLSWQACTAGRCCRRRIRIGRAPPAHSIRLRSPRIAARRWRSAMP